MIFDLGVFALGLSGLYWGAEWLVKGASQLALQLGVQSVVVGLTVIALGTSSPELVVSLIAAVKQSQGLALGNIIGSNIANVGLVLGLSAMVAPLKIDVGVLRREMPVMLGVSVVFYAMAADLTISRWESLLLVCGLVGYIGYHLVSAMRSSAAKRDERDNGVKGEDGSRAKNALLGVAGIALLVGGAQLMVRAGVAISKDLGISEVVIGIVLLAVGTSLPELATSIVSARRRQSDLSISNVVGSNLLNILLVVGVVGLVSPLAVDAALLSFELPVMLVFSFVLLPLMKSGSVLNRWEGACLAAGYAAFIVWMFLTVADRPAAL